MEFVVVMHVQQNGEGPEDPQYGYLSFCLGNNKIFSFPSSPNIFFGNITFGCARIPEWQHARARDLWLFPSIKPVVYLLSGSEKGSDSEAVPNVSSVWSLFIFTVLWFRGMEQEAFLESWCRLFNLVGICFEALLFFSFLSVRFFLDSPLFLGHSFVLFCLVALSSFSFL